MPDTDTGLGEQRPATFTVHMVRPPASAAEVLFYPGQLDHTDRDTVAVESYKTAANPLFGTVDRVDSSHPPSSSGFYKVSVQYPNATEDELRNSGTNYPAWITPYLSYPGLTGTPAFSSQSTGVAGQRPTTSLTITASGASSPSAIQIKTLADQVTTGLTDPYDRAAAIESYLRSNYT